MRAALFALACLPLLAPSRTSAQSLPSPTLDPADAGVPASGPGQAGPQTTALPPAAATPPPGLAIPAPQAPPVAEGFSRLAGRVTIAGLAPRLASVPVGKDMKICGTSKPDQALQIGAAGGIGGAVVWLTGGPPHPAGVRAKSPGRPARVKLDQTGCEFVPHVLAAMAGSELDIVNSDPVLHNVHARAEDKTVFNYAMPIRGYVIPRKLAAPGVLVVSCDAHPWMHARVHVLPTAAFAVTDARGDFRIDAPPGTYALHLSHERLGQREEPVELTAGATLRHDISLTPR